MQEKLQSLTIIFENCESITLTPDMFKGLIVSGITENYFINCCQYIDGEVLGERYKCNEFQISINTKGMDTLTQMGTSFEETLKDRLKHSDITHVRLNFNDKSHEMAVPWDSEDQYTNLKQSVIFHADRIDISIRD